MAQSQVSAPWLGEAGGAGHWESTGPVGEQPLDIWSQLPTPPVTQPSTTITQPSTTITQKPDRTEIGHVLAAWRAAERRLEEHIEASPMRFAVLSEIARLRAEYQRLFALAMR